MPYDPDDNPDGDADKEQTANDATDDGANN